MIGAAVLATSPAFATDLDIQDQGKALTVLPRAGHEAEDVPRNLPRIPVILQQTGEGFVMGIDFDSNWSKKPNFLDAPRRKLNDDERKEIDELFAEIDRIAKVGQYSQTGIC